MLAVQGCNSSTQSQGPAVRIKQRFSIWRSPESAIKRCVGRYLLLPGSNSHFVINYFASRSRFIKRRCIFSIVGPSFSFDRSDAQRAESLSGTLRRCTGARRRSFPEREAVCGREVGPLASPLSRPSTARRVFAVGSVAVHLIREAVVSLPLLWALTPTLPNWHRYQVSTLGSGHVSYRTLAPRNDHESARNIGPQEHCGQRQDSPGKPGKHAFQRHADQRLQFHVVIQGSQLVGRVTIARGDVDNPASVLRHDGELSLVEEGVDVGADLICSEGYAEFYT